MEVDRKGYNKKFGQTPNFPAGFTSEKRAAFVGGIHVFTIGFFRE
jgi:hypothetical protein